MAVTDYLPYAQFAAQFALIAGAFFAGYQFLLTRRQREDEAALGVLTNLQDGDFRVAYATVWTLPIGASPQQVEEEAEEAANCVIMTFESLGVMVHSRIVPLDVVDQVIGGFLRESWRRLEPAIQERRRALGAPRYAEWYQWLAEQAEVRRKRRTVPAHEAFKAWRE